MASYLPVPEESEEREKTGQEEQSALVAVLQTRIHAYETRISNLEEFKKLFFDLKMKQVNSAQLAAHAELEEKFAGMEQLYLTTYQENQRLSEAAGAK